MPPPHHRSSRRSRDRRTPSPFRTSARKRSNSSSPDDSKNAVKNKYSSRLLGSRHTHKTVHRRNKSRRSRSSSSSSSTESQSHKSSSVERKYAEKRHNSPKMPSKTSASSLNICSQINQKVLDQIEADCFSSLPFTSSSKKIPDKVVIDLQNESVSVAPTENANSSSEAIFHNKFFASEEVRLEKWVKKLFNYRQRCCQE